MIENYRFSFFGRQSLVTPIDWKRLKQQLALQGFRSRQSLVTPIDWKRP